VVKKGDTLATIAGRFGVSIDDLRRWNKAAQGRLAAGQRLAVAAPQAAAKKSTHGKLVKKGGQPVKKTAKPVQKAKPPVKKS
jgi:LysM repeat protein